MNSINSASNFLYSKITELLPSARVFNGVAPENAAMPLICFYIVDTEPTRYIQNLRAWDEVNVLVHVWGESYQYETAQTVVDGIDGLQGVEIGSSGYLQSARFMGQEPLVTSEGDSTYYGLVLKFRLRVK